ncbi:hypothetical protein ACNKHR_21780 [Shigella flexneri]
MFPQCKFSRQFLHPRYWLTWFGLGVIWLWVQLPYPVLCFLGTRIGGMARPFLKPRESIARKNLELCFPQHSAEERQKMIASPFVDPAWRGKNRHGMVLARQSRTQAVRCSEVG